VAREDSGVVHLARGAARLPICDTLGVLLETAASRRVLLIRDTLVPNPGGGGVPWPRRGCSIHVVDSVGRGPPATAELEHWFLAHGWGPAPYGADSPDGTMFGLFRDPELCILHGRWNADSADVALPGYKLTVQCVPATPGDTVQ